MELGMVGLGKMGAYMVERLVRGGHRVAGYDRDAGAVARIVDIGAEGADSLATLAKKLAAPRAIWIMVPSGSPVDDTIAALVPLLAKGDILIDGGNSNYKDTQRRAAHLKSQGFQFVDVGTSGGVWGLKEGYSMMVGGDKIAVDLLRPLLETLAPAKDKGWGHVGASGAGHFVKMVHNGIEYGMMQAYAEGFAILKKKNEFALDLHQVSEIWRTGSVVRSWLLDLLSISLKENAEMSGIAPYVSDSGEGRWTVAEAIDLDVPAPVITLSLLQRLTSRDSESYSDKLLAAMRNQFGGHAIKAEAKKMRTPTMTPGKRSAPKAGASLKKSSITAADPCTIVIFGASGDLSRRKLVPALYGLAAQDCLARRFAIIGFARTPMTDEAFQASAVDSVKKFADAGAAQQEEKCAEFVKALAYVAGEYHRPEAFEKLKQRLEELDRKHKLHGNRLFYLATPPDVYPLVIEQLENAGLARNPNGKSWVRIIIEKPYGRDLESAKKLNQAVLKVFDEEQVYRIDHYLGKDTVQNLMVLRFGNGIFEPLWNRNYVDSVQITAAETLGVEQRAAFYETAGATRDMIQSHVLQLTSLVAMEPPAAFDATAVRNEKIKVLQSIRPFTEQSIKTDVVRGQYGPGSSRGDSSLLSAYRKEPRVAKDSRTETYVALRLQIDNWRWAGVPFYLRTGKRLPDRVSEIAIQFRSAPHMVFRGQGLAGNTLVLNVQPDEGISISFHAKLPGQEMKLKPVTMDFSYQKEFGAGERSAYATLLNDCMRGDATLFDRADGVEAAWALVNPILEWFKSHKPKFPNYAAGTWGPEEADKLLERDGRHWRKP